MKRLLTIFLLSAVLLSAAETRKTIAQCQTLLADNAAGDISPQDFRDCLIATALLAPVNAQTGTTYTVQASDRGKNVTHSNGSAIAVTLPRATGAFGDGFWYLVKNLGAGTATITPTTSTIAGGATLALTTGQWGIVFSDGTNYNFYGVRLTAGASITITDAVTGQTIAVTDAELVALAGLSGTGVIAKTGAGTMAERTVTGTANEIDVANGNGVSGNPTLSLAAAVSSWVKYTVTFEDAAFIVADTGASASLFTLPAKGVITGVRIKTSTAFAGTAVSAVTCSVGDAAGDTNDPDAYMVAYDVFAATGDTNQAWDGGAYSTTAAQQDVELHCTCNVNFGNGSATVLTAGSVDVHVEWATLP